jgi:cell division transport system permease protein
MRFHIRKALRDIRDNRFLNLITVITIALSILIVSAFALFIENANEILRSWEKGVRIMVYPDAKMSPTNRLELEQRILALSGVVETRFISKEEALALLKKQMKGQPSLFEDLKENPLPDAFEIRVKAIPDLKEGIAKLATGIKGFPHVEAVEYGQKWLGRFSRVLDLFRMTAYAMGVLFLMAAVFIVANTIRLLLYSRREEIEIMRLVGASDHFIKAPFYIEGLIHGALGSILGVSTLLVVFASAFSNIGRDFSSGFFQIRFLSPCTVLSVVGCSMLVGWLGCYLSLKQFLK